MKKIVVAAVVAMSAFGLSSCATDADVVSENLSKAADQFEVTRRVVFINNNDKSEYLLEIEGRCNIVAEPDQLEVTCKAAGGEYKKHFLGLNERTTYVVEQLEGANVSADHYKVIFKPTVIVPDVDVK